MNEYILDELRFEVRQSSLRRVIEITVKRDGSLLLQIPEGVDESRLRTFVASKRPWIYGKIAERERLGSAQDPKRYLEGEGFLYLGRSYRLRLVDDQEVPLRFDKGRFLFERGRIAEARQVFQQWYAERAKLWASKYVSEFASRMRVSPSGLIVRDLGFRWGSCGKGERLYFHWKIALLSPPLIEYLVVHELAHLREPHHTPEFWLIVERAMPDYQERKARLESKGVGVEGAV